MTGPVTLGFLLDHDHGLRATCQACGHQATLQIAMLAAKYGRETTVPQIRGALRCTECPATRVVVSVESAPA